MTIHARRSQAGQLVAILTARDNPDRMGAGRGVVAQPLCLSTGTGRMGRQNQQGMDEE